MEDLETVSKEKDKIEEERLKAETKFEESRKAALEEKKNFSAVQKEAANRLEALQAGMEAKQKVIADLTKAQTEAARLAGESNSLRQLHCTALHCTALSPSIALKYQLLNLTVDYPAALLQNKIAGEHPS